MRDRRFRAYAGSFLDASPSTSITPSMTTSSSSERCGARDESVALSSSLDGKPAADDFLERVLVARGLCTAPPHRGHRDHCRCISAGAQRPQNPIEHRVEFLSQVLGEIAQDEIAVLLQQLILASIAAVRDGVREMLTAIDFDDEARIRA
jgi:hypothetical protein